MRGGPGEEGTDPDETPPDSLHRPSGHCTGNRRCACASAFPPADRLVAAGEARASQAKEFSNQDQTTFAAIGQGHDNSGVAVTVVVSALDGALGANYTIYYSRSESDGSRSWQLVGADAAQLEGGQVSGAGDFRRIIGGQLLDDTDAGSFTGSCSPNSIGVA